MLDLDHHARLKRRHKPLQFDGYGIRTDLDRRENVRAVSASIGRFRDGSRFVLKKDFRAYCSVASGIYYRTRDGSGINLRECAPTPENYTKQEATRLYQPNKS